MRPVRRACAISSSLSLYTGAGVSIYVVDSGVNNVPDIAGRLRYARGFVTDVNGNLDPSTADCINHGTPVATLAAGTVYGVAPGATIVGVRVIDRDSSAKNSDMAAAFVWITRGQRQH